MLDTTDTDNIHTYIHTKATQSMYAMYAMREVAVRNISNEQSAAFYSFSTEFFFVGATWGQIGIFLSFVPSPQPRCDNQPIRRILAIRNHML